MAKTLADLKQDPRNARRRTERNLEMIEASIREVGAGRAITIDEVDTVIAGSGALLAAQAAGLTKVKVVDAAPDEMVAVRRSGLTPEQRTRMALADNRSAETSEWDADVLTAMRDEGTLNDLFTAKELDALVGTDDEDDDEAGAVQVLEVERPLEIVWVLCAIPVSDWPNAQLHVEQLQNTAVFSSMVMREKTKS